jgi:hypothetical protein
MHTLIRAGINAMTNEELKKLIDANNIGYIVINDRWRDGNEKAKKELGCAWEVWAFDYENEITVKSFGNVLTNSSRKKEKKTYASLNRAYETVKKLGFKGKVLIDG